MSRLRGVWGWENSSVLGIRSIANMSIGATEATRETTTISPRGGLASLAMAQTSTSTDYRVQVLAINDTSDATAAVASGGAFAFDFRTPASGLSELYFVCSMQFDGNSADSDVNLMWDSSDGLLKWYEQDPAAVGKGTLATSGVKVLAAETWYRLWVYVSFSGANITTKVSVGSISAELLTMDAQATTVPGASTSIAGYQFYLGGRVSTTAPGGTGYYDNVTYWDQVTDGDQKSCVIIRGTVSANGTHQEWSVTNTGGDTSHHEAVGNAGATPEPPENGSGTTDVDLVNSGVENTQETFEITWETFPDKFQNPLGLLQEYWHRNSTGTKWGGASNKYMALFQGTTFEPTGPSDPGTSYVERSTLIRRPPPGLVSSTANEYALRLEDLRDTEIGMDHGTGDTPNWVVSTITAETVLEHFQTG